MARILVVDDESENRYLLEVLLRGNGHQVDSAANGAEALEAARRAPPALVLSDILMPVMDGFVFCREWRSDARLGRIPFVFYTATYTEEADERFALSLGADRFLRKPLEPGQILAVVDEFLGGVSPADPSARGTDLAAELAFLAAHDEALARKLQQKHEQLQKSERKYRSYFDSSPVAIIVLDGSGSILDFNPAACRLSLYPASELRGKKLSDLADPSSAPAALAALASFPATGATLATYRHRRRDGTVRVVQVTAIRLDSARILAFCEDVTEQVGAEETVRRANADLEKRVLERTLQLEQLNRELEAFTYSVSHDLRAPLRAVEGYSAILQRAAGDRLDEESRELVESIRRSALRMSDLINDLLTLSKASRQDLRVGHVDMQRLAEAVLGEVLPADELGRSDVTLGPLPAAVGDEGLVRQVFTNLLGNAVKFSAKKERRSIEVGARRIGNETAYFVRDDGVGFPASSSDRLFKSFQRLHDARDFEGTGIGLALVRRIVERHGGRVWAESAPGAGATFWFVLGETGAPEDV
jgi:hypothetical protein